MWRCQSESVILMKVKCQLGKRKNNKMQSGLGDSKRPKNL